MSAEMLATIIGAVLTGGIGTKLLDNLWPLIAGRGERRRDGLERAWTARDREARKRRQIEEFASKLIRRLVEAPCVPADSIPEWPPYSDTGPTKTKE